jgi:acetyl esterase/lipase
MTSEALTALAVVGDSAGGGLAVALVLIQEAAAFTDSHLNAAVAAR